MLFNTPIFLFCFLPVVLACYLVLPRVARPGFLTAASLFFYWWGEGSFTLILLGYIAVNYGAGRAMTGAASPRVRRTWLVAAILANLSPLFVFKYSGFLAELVNRAAARPLLGVPALHLPIGISFYTFMGLAYMIDIYRRQAEAERRPVPVALYLVLFPHLVAGPIVRFKEIAAQLMSPVISLERVALGARRFVIGLAKKVLLADSVAAASDAIFALPAHDLTAPVAWLGIVCYTLQIYFDFSGYSDMAIGLAKMFGIDFPENFNYPYVSRSLTEFWRRWHITLSSWLRDYLFVPLGVRGPRLRLYVNLFLVFLICGLWHGASMAFVIWGAWHGAVLVLERMLKLDTGRRLPRPLAHAYLLLVVMIGWVVFRAPGLADALEYLRVMFLGGSASGPALNTYLNQQLIIALVAGTLAALPFAPWLLSTWRSLAARPGGVSAVVEAPLRLARVAFLAVLLVASSALVAAGTYKAFIYFRF